MGMQRDITGYGTFTSYNRLKYTWVGGFIHGNNGEPVDLSRVPGPWWSWFHWKNQTTEMVFFEQELWCFPMIFSLELVLGAMDCWCKSAWLYFKSLGSPQNLTGEKEMFHHVSHFWTDQHGDLGNLCQRYLCISFNMDKNWPDRKTAIVVRMQCNQNAICWCHSSFRPYLQEVWINWICSQLWTSRIGGLPFADFTDFWSLRFLGLFFLGVPDPQGGSHQDG